MKTARQRKEKGIRNIKTIVILRCQQRITLPSSQSQKLSLKFMYLPIGILGSILCIIALALTLRNGKFGESTNYKLLNFCGGVCLLYYAIITESLPFIILESIWVLLPLISLVKKFCQKRIINY